MDLTQVDFGAFGSQCGYQIVQWEPGLAVIHMPIAAWMLNRSGLPHGGIIAALIDTVAGFAGTHYTPPEPRPLGLTLSMSTTFLARAEGKTLVATARRTGGGRSIFFSRVEVTDELGTLVATGECTYRHRQNAQ